MALRYNLAVMQTSLSVYQSLSQTANPPTFIYPD
jgi:hypothetical protein